MNETANPACPAQTADLPERLLRRADFLAAAKGRRRHGTALVLQSIARRGASCPARIGFTVTKKVGNAAVRNRIRRRLRAAVMITGGLSFRAGHDYVLVARLEALTLPFPDLLNDLASTLSPAPARATQARTSEARDPPKKPDQK